MPGSELGSGWWAYQDLNPGPHPYQWSWVWRPTPAHEKWQRGRGPRVVDCSAEGASAASTASVTCEFALAAGHFQPRHIRGMCSCWWSVTGPAHWWSAVDRGCPLYTVRVRLVWHAGGMRRSGRLRHFFSPDFPAAARAGAEDPLNHAASLASRSALTQRRNPATRAISCCGCESPMIRSSRSTREGP